MSKQTVGSVPERCPDCGMVLQHPGTDKWMPIEEGTTAHTKERCLEHQLTAARAEADGLRSRVRTLEDERDILDEGLVVLELAIHYGDWTAVKAYYRAANKLLSGDDTGEEMQQRIQRVREHIAESTRAEAERLRQRYEALRAGVERVAQELHKRAHASAKEWRQSGHPYYDGESDAYYLAEQMVRRLLTEAGGGKRD